MLDEAVMEENGVELVILFGSAATKRQHPLSDTDIGVVFANPEKRHLHPVEVYSALYDEFKKHYAGKIDLVYLDEAPLSLRYRAANDGLVLYQAGPSSFANYKERALKYYFDFRFIEDIFHRALLARHST